MKRNIYIENGSFVPLADERILYNIPAMTCGKYLKECPIEANGCIDDYRYRNAFIKDKPSVENCDYCAYLAGEIADGTPYKSIDLEYIVDKNMYKVKSGNHRMCVAQRLNALNCDKCKVKVNLKIVF